MEFVALVGGAVVLALLAAGLVAIRRQNRHARLAAKRPRDDDPRPFRETMPTWLSRGRG